MQFHSTVIYCNLSNWHFTTLATDEKHVVCTMVCGHRYTGNHGGELQERSAEIRPGGPDLRRRTVQAPFLQTGYEQRSLQNPSSSSQALVEAPRRDLGRPGPSASSRPSKPLRDLGEISAGNLPEPSFHSLWSNVGWPCWAQTSMTHCNMGFCMACTRFCTDPTHVMMRFQTAKVLRTSTQ